MRRLAGFLIAPLPSAILTTLWYVLFPGPLMAASMAVAILLYLYAVQLVFGMATAVWLDRRRKGGVANYVLAGAVIAGLPLLIFMLWEALSRSQDWEMVLRGPFWFSVLGGLAGATYWLVARPDLRLRADRTA